MSTSKKFSELPAASSVGNGDLFAIAHEDVLAETGFVSQKLTAAQAGQKVNGDTEYPTSLPSFPANGQNPFAALEKLNADIEGLYPVNTASGAIANFTTSLAKPLTELTSTIVAQQSGTGTPSPSNPRSISGVSSVDFYQRGVNLWDEDTEIGNIDNDGQDSPSNNILRTKGYISIKPNIELYFKCSASSGHNLTVFYYDVNKSFISLTYRQNQTGTTPANAYYMRFKIGSSYGTTYNNDISINYPSTDTQYHAYNPQSETKTIALGQTVYGGVIDVKNGKLVVTYGIIDLGTLNWTKNVHQTLGEYYYADVWALGVKYQGAYTTPYNNICEAYQVVGRTASTFVDFSLTFDGSASRVTQIQIKNSNCSDGTEMENALNGVHLCFQLATPIEITGLTPDNFTTIAGVNNIFSDCGEVSVGFKQGIQEYIDAKIAETQALIL